MSFRFLPMRARPLLVFCYAFLLCEATFDNGTSYILGEDESGAVQISDPTTGDTVDQSPASDGSGDGMNLPALLWIIFAFLLGVPLLTMGVRLGRFTSGVGLGLGLAVALWASVINTVGEGNISDLVILAIAVVLFLIGFVVGVITIDYFVGVLALGAAGGMSVAMRAVLMREDLLVPIYYVNWILCGVFGAVGLFLAALTERWGVIIGSSSAGSFLVGLGVDLLINKQSGMSRGLRFLFDRNKSHLADILGNGYKPPMSTIVIMAVTLALIPIFSFAQHKIFPRPFHKARHRPASLLGDDASVRSRTWIGKIRGRTTPRPNPSIITDDPASTQALVTHSEEEATLATPTGYQDALKEKSLAATGVPKLKYTEH
ncbi:hypothetical protein ACEPAI_4890 [Sanghuangporus weigelae]